MKKIIIPAFLFYILFSTVSFAQDKDLFQLLGFLNKPTESNDLQNKWGQMTIPLSKNNSKGILNISDIDGPVKVTGYNGDKVIIKYYPGDEKRYGGKRINVYADANSNMVSISSGNSDESVQLEISVPYNLAVNINSTSDEDIAVNYISGDITISSTDGDVKLFSISGSTVVSTVDGNITADINKFYGQTLKLNAVDGNVDIKLPSDSKAELKVMSDGGDIYTDFNISLTKHYSDMEKSQKDGLTRISLDGWLYGNINGGGSQISIKTSDGNVYIRKK